MVYVCGILLVHPTDPILGLDMTDAEKFKAIAKILKRHFTNLTVEQTIDITSEIMEEVKKS